jgi:uncharacterized membrane protein YjdF
MKNESVSHSAGRQSRPAAPGSPGNPTKWMMFGEFPIATALFIVASLNLAYRPFWLIAVLSVALFITFRAYLNWRYRISMPVVVLLPAFAAVGIDTVGNYFRLYQRLPWPVAYDVLAHLTIPALLVPAMIWLLREWLEKLGHRLPLVVVTFFAVNVNFSLTSFYEITELWDDLYFGGSRIEGIHDTTRDLQYDLIGTVAGAIVTFAVMKSAETGLPPFGKR